LKITIPGSIIIPRVGWIFPYRTCCEGLDLADATLSSFIETFRCTIIVNNHSHREKSVINNFLMYPYAPKISFT
jgi:hypothetical protein